VGEVCTIIKDAMPMAIVVEEIWGIFSSWANFEGPARPVETVMDSIVQD
jgi:hypothetical protein